MGFNLHGGFLNCYRCGSHSLLSTLLEVTNEQPHTLRALLVGIESTLEAKVESKRGKLILPKPLEELSRPFRDYLRGRGYDPAQLVELWGLQALGMLGHVKKPDGKRINLAWRIFIPFIHDSATVSWNTRTINPEVTLRYVTAPEECEAMNAKELLYGANRGNRHACCAVEGAFDVWAGGPGFVGTGGTAFKRAQVLALSQYHIRGVCYDAEPEAQRRARELVDMLSTFPGKTFNFILDSKDPSEDMMNNNGREVAQIRKTLGL